VIETALAVKIASLRPPRRSVRKPLMLPAKAFHTAQVCVFIASLGIL
jgi:hypothetical protein